MSVVTVIIPCYNAERWVRFAIASALAQSYSSIEVVVIDDGSTDGSLGVIKEFNSRIRWLTGPNRGSSAARNRGLAAARGEWIQFLDADDVMHPQKIELSVKALGVYPTADFVYSPYLKFEGDIPRMEAYNNLQFEATRSADCALRATYAPSAGFFRKKFLDKVGPWNESLRRWVDLEYHARIVSLTPYFVRLAPALYFYRQHGEGQISYANRQRSDFECGLESIISTRKALETSPLELSQWNSFIFPFYIELSRSAGKKDNADMFRALLREAAILRGSFLFSVKCKLVMVCVSLVGMRRTSMIVEFFLGRRGGG
jgi:glycosyltransferase involved in cell wall biosynthesis